MNTAAGIHFSGQLLWFVNLCEGIHFLWQLLWFVRGRALLVGSSFGWRTLTSSWFVQEWPAVPLAFGFG